VVRLRRLCCSVVEAMWWGKIENKAKLSPSKAGARAELGKKNLMRKKNVKTLKLHLLKTLKSSTNGQRTKHPKTCQSSKIL
jgi:hypothetical protein